MPGCDRCGGEGGFLFRCGHCGHDHCHDHRSPEAHACSVPWPPGRVDEVLSQLVAEAAPTSPDAEAESVAEGPAVDESEDAIPALDTTPGQTPTAADPDVAADAPSDDVLTGNAKAGSDEAAADAAEGSPPVESAPAGSRTRPRALGRRIPTLGLVLLVVLCSAIGGVALLSTTTGADVPATIGAIEHGRLPFVSEPTAVGGPNRTAVEEGVVEALDQRRRAADLAPVAADPALSAIARAHSEDMAANDYAAHTGPDGDTVGDRLGAYPGTCRPDGELVLYTYYDRPVRVGNGTERYTTEAALADGIVRSWSRSTTHRAAMLDPAWRRAGVGVAVTDDGEVYVTLDLCGSG